MIWHQIDEGDLLAQFSQYLATAYAGSTYRHRIYQWLQHPNKITVRTREPQIIIQGIEILIFLKNTSHDTVAIPDVWLVCRHVVYERVS